MKRAFKRIVIALVAIAIFIIAAFQLSLYLTKRDSPAGIATYQEHGLDIEINYSRPSANGRTVFGGLVPYGMVWRTGANEPTTFTTATNIRVNGKFLSAGQYTLWTIPEHNQWTVIWNSGKYFWGVNTRDEAARDPKFDVLSVKATPQDLLTHREMFTIELEGSPAILSFSWANTRVEVLIEQP